MQKPNPNDPSLVDIYDDATGAFLTTVPAEAQALTTALNGPQPTQAPAAAPAPAAFSEGLGIMSVGSADTRDAVFDPKSGEYKVRPKSTPSAQGDDKKLISGALGQTDATGAPLQAPPANADEQLLTPGSADAQTEELLSPGTEGGFQPQERVTKGLTPDGQARVAGMEGDVASLERDAALAEAAAMEQQLEADRARQAEMERQVKEDMAKQALEQKLIVERRAKVERIIAQTAAQEPDRHRAFPKGWNGVQTMIGSIAGGMLSGLTDGRYQNQTLGALEKRLDDDVREQRETQSNMLKELTRQLGSIDAAEDMLRAKQKEIVLKELEARLLGSQNKVQPAKIEAFRKRMQADIARHQVDALTKLERDETIKDVNTPGSAPMAFNAENYRAQALQKYAAENGLPTKEAHKQWVTYNKGFQDRATLRKSLETANRLIDQYEKTNDVAGLGPIAKFIPTSVNTQDAKAVRQALGFATAQYLKQVSGAAVTEQEFARTRETIEAAGSYDDVKRGLNLLGQSVKAADEESQVENPGFYRLRGELGSLNRQGGLRGSAGRAEQEAAAGDIVAIPRSSRIAFAHNNPGNLTFADQAGATRGEPKEGGGYWAQFQSPGDGMRALARQVMKDQERGLNLRQFVEKYAPKGDGNNVENYLIKLNRLTGADEETPLAEMSAGAMAYAIAQIESGTRPTK
jgi:hypothetical protein